MDSSPFNENPNGPQRNSHIFNSPDPARQLFTNNGPPPPNRHLQTTYDLISSASATPPPPASLRGSTPGSVARVPKIDQSNEIIRGDLNSVRYELSTLKEERQLEKIRHEQEVRALEAKVEEQAKRADAVESDKRFLFDERNDLSQKLQKVKDSATKHRAELERQIRRFKAENTEVKGWVQDKQEELDTQERGFRRQREEYSGRNKMLEKENSELREEVQNKERTLAEVQGKLEGKDAEVEELQMEVLRVKAQTGDVDTLKVLKKELSEQVNHIKSLENTNRRQLAELKALREGHKSIDVLQEEKRALEGKVKAMDELREQLSAVQLRASVLQDERNAWESYFQSEELEFDSPESLAKALIEERVEKAALFEKAGRSNPELQQKEEQIQDMEGEIGVLKKELESLKESATKDAKARQRMERQRSLALKEAQFLREQLKSFQTEETMFMEKGAYDEQKTRSIQELEALLEEYKIEIERLKAEAASSRNENELPVSRKRAFEENNDERLGELTRRNRQLQEEIAQLERREIVLTKEIEALQFRITAMEGTSTRVLQLKDNPTAREQAVKVSQLIALREENAALLAQLEDRAPGVGRVVPLASLENARSDIKSMEKVVAEKEKRMTRLKEIWSAKSMEFREAVYSLLGWKLDFMPNGRVRVTHMFAGNEDQSIEFDGEKGTMKVAGGPDSMFHKEIKNQCAFWMARQSIPCLLASILIEQYEKTTRAQMM